MGGLQEGLAVELANGSMAVVVEAGLLLTVLLLLLLLLC
jgi:hypothetical protein